LDGFGRFFFGSGSGLDWIWTVFLRFGSGWFFFGLDLDFYRIGFLVFLVLDSVGLSSVWILVVVFLSAWILGGFQRNRFMVLR